MARNNNNTEPARPAGGEPLENQLWKAADKLRKNIDAAEYTDLRLIFLKYISDAFEELHDKLKSGEGEYAGADAEDRDEYKAENVLFVICADVCTLVSFAVTNKASGNRQRCGLGNGRH